MTSLADWLAKAEFHIADKSILVDMNETERITTTKDRREQRVIRKGPDLYEKYHRRVENAQLIKHLDTGNSFHVYLLLKLGSEALCIQGVSNLSSHTNT